MNTFIMMTTLSPEAMRSPHSLEDLERTAMDRVRTTCPEVKWLASYAVTGPCDYVDVFQARSLEEAMKVSALVRTFGHASTTLWPATAWDRFKDTIRDLPSPQ